MNAVKGTLSPLYHFGAYLILPYGYEYLHDCHSSGSKRIEQYRTLPVKARSEGLLKAMCPYCIDKVMQKQVQEHTISSPYSRAFETTGSEASRSRRVERSGRPSISEMPSSRRFRAGQFAIAGRRSKFSSERASKRSERR